MTTSPFGDLAVIVDPSAGRRPSDVAGEAHRVVEERGLAHRIFLAEDDRAATRLATEAIDGGFRYLAAVGDDRTVQDVVNGMFRDGRPIAEGAVLAVLPSAGCDLLKSFGLPDDLEGASHHLLGEETYALDVMKVAATARDGRRTVRYGHNVAEIGLHAAMAARTARVRGGSGGARAFGAFWGAYLTSRTRDVRLQLDGKTHDLRAWSLVVGNGQFSEGLRMSPRSFPGDGILDALAFVGPRSDAYRMLPRLFRHGDHIPDPGIKEFRARLTVQVGADRAMPVVVDGVVFGSTPVTIQVLAQPIRLKL